MLRSSSGVLRRRLTEPSDLALAAEFLLARGFSGDEIAVQLSRFYYIDIDALNDVVENLTKNLSQSQKNPL